MDVKIYPSYVYCSSMTSAEEERLLSMLSVRSDGYYFSKAYKSGKWDGFLRFYSKAKKCFPIGFWPIVKGDFKVNNIVDFRSNNTDYSYDFKLSLTLRDYQAESVGLALAKKMGIINLAVNSGKTLIFIVLAMILRKNRVLIITHRTDILDTIMDKFNEYVSYDDVGVIMSGDVRPSDTITVAMVQTLSNNLTKLKKWFDGVNVIMVDEAHHVSSSVYTKILKKSRAYMRFGFSGTIPDAGTVQWFKTVQFMGDRIAQIDSKYLIDAGISAKPVIRVVKTKSIPVNRYEDSIKYNVIYNRDKILKISKIVEQHKGQKILIITDFIAQGRILSRVLTGFNHKNIFLYSNVEERKNLFAKFTSGRIKLLIATTIVDEGIDISDIEVVILAFPRKSYRQVLQRIGRGMRIDTGKDEVIVYDMFDTDDTYLRVHFRKRAKHYDNESFEWQYWEVKHEAKSDKERIKTIERECLQEVSDSDGSI